MTPIEWRNFAANLPIPSMAQSRPRLLYDIDPTYFEARNGEGCQYLGAFITDQKTAKNLVMTPIVWCNFAANLPIPSMA
ncbi:hypothetical protein FJM67_12480 [Maribrevibacterium harenarium]|uniref:Uncharacterized protein n=1 Tax=Maribrevibacterium harenarium TaxID=2589817 RepID=A0A501WT79_9GAMM|nr:hypothetical protein [Maribrevibacterium harenarium]TPE49006.1 hypothetical protein FJM67_12480 [Maribrevibacterium harenarium]